MKKSFKAAAVMLLTGSMLSSVFTPAFAAGESASNAVKEEQAPTPEENSIDLPPLDTGKGIAQFKDVPAKTELAYAVQFLYENGIARGYGETFGVNELIKRVDFAVILGTYMPLYTNNVPKSEFRDLPARAERIVSTLKYNKIVNGKTAIAFGAGDNITRGEAAVILHNAFKDYFDSSEAIKNPFTDASARYAEAVRVLHGAGIIKGINQTKFGTNNSITRGQFAMLIHRIYKHEQKLRAEEKSGFVAFGDSNTSGSYFKHQFSAYETKKWTDQVAAAYGAELKEDIYNAGVSGDDTNEGINRFKKEVLDAKPESVTIMFGINDALLYKGQPQVSKEKFRQNLEYIINQLRIRNIKVVLMTNPSVVEKTYYELELSNGRNVASSYATLGGLRNWINSYNDIIREVAKKRDIPLVDVHRILVEEAGGATDAALIKSGLLDDVTGIHMTPKANDLIAKAVKEAFIKK